MNKPKRIIKSHKGGRKVHFPNSRITPEVRAKLDVILAARNMSAADWVTEKIEQEPLPQSGKITVRAHTLGGKAQ